ncbi:pyridoxal phosphate-dependent transferase [Cubamyces menziesii]|nr:pyridoxal phosphate-dependent transferase [Cubamyces menziesii]
MLDKPKQVPFRKSSHNAISAAFLGPVAENFRVLQELLLGALTDHADMRESYESSDGAFITSSIRDSPEYRDAINVLRAQAQNISTLLNTTSVPFFSVRYTAHMVMEPSMPSIVGSMIAMLFNQNNVTMEVSPATTCIEVQVGEQLCSMLGYTTRDGVSPWGQIVAGGTVANIESMWYVLVLLMSFHLPVLTRWSIYRAARNLKFYAFSVHAAMTQGDKPLEFMANDFTVTTCDEPNTPQLLSKLTPWQLLNLTPDVVLDIPRQLASQFGITSDFLGEVLEPYLVQTMGKEKIKKMYNIDDEPLCFVPSTKHYSWPKAAALVGIGRENCVNVKVDINARIDIDALTTALQDCVDEKRAVYVVVAIIGSTEEGSVDPLDQILALKPKFAKQGLSFLVHADAAWGGYYASMIRERPAPARLSPQINPNRDFVPSITLRKSTVAQLEALAHTDSITIDPHKAGYIPYPAGALCYRDSRMPLLLTWSAPYIGDRGGNGGSIGTCGIQGSKPGAAAVACFLHHCVLGLHKEGHGALLGEVSFTCRRIAAHWSAMSTDTTSFIVVPFNPVNESDKELIRERILEKSNEEIVDDPQAFKVLCELGSDLNINAFACNFRINGRVNDDVEEANYLNNRVYSRFSTPPPKSQIDIKTVPLFLSATIFRQNDYGDCVKNFQARLQLETDSGQDLFVLRNAVMSPFQSAGNYVLRLAESFKAGLEEEVKNVVARNTLSPQIHTFIMQGHEALYLVYRPLFHHANGRQQLILAARFSDPAQASIYKELQHDNPGLTFELSTDKETTVGDILSCRRLIGSVAGRPFLAMLMSSVEITITSVIKDRPLNSRWRDSAYPASYTPFYLYGTLSEKHIDHMLLRAPNAQISSDMVTLDCTPPLTPGQLVQGVIARLNRPEASMQPLVADAARFFEPGASFNVAIYADSKLAKASGPGLSQGGAQIATGKLTLGEAIFYDADRINTADFADGPKVSAYMTGSTVIEPSVQKEWQTLVGDALGFGKSTARKTGA